MSAADPLADGLPLARSDRGLRRLAVAGIALAIAAAVALAFSPVFSAGFVNWDDPANLEDLRTYRGDVWHFWHSPGQIDPYQPLSWWSLMLDHAAWGWSGGLDSPQAGRYHATSVLFHALAAIAFFFVARRLLAAASPSVSLRARTLGAAFASCVFAIHPLRVESVAWLSERRDVVSGLFYVLAAAAWLRSVPRERPRGVPLATSIACAACALVCVVMFFVSIDLEAGRTLRWMSVGPAGLIAGALALCGSVLFGARASGRHGASAAWYVLAVATFFIALFSKGLTVVLPLVLLVADVWPLKRFDPRTWPALVVEKLPLFALALIAGSLASWAQVNAGDTLASWSEHTLGERIAQAFYGLAFYPWRTLVPHALMPVYELPEDLRWSEPRFAISIAAVSAAAVLLIVMRKRWPGTLAALTAFALAIAPVLGLWQAGPQLVADRYSYLSCMPLAVLAGGACAAWFDRSRVLASTAASLVVVALGWLTCAQTSSWRDSDALWTRAHSVEPDNAMAAMNLGVALAQSAESVPDAARAIELYEQALALYERARASSDDPRIALNRSQAWTQLGILDEARRERASANAVEDARSALAAASARGMFAPEYRLQYGTALINAGRIEDGLEHLQWYVKARPGRMRGLTNLGRTLMLLGRAAEALPWLERATRVAPDDPRVWEFVASAYAALGRTDDARAAQSRAAELSRGATR